MIFTVLTYGKEGRQVGQALCLSFSWMLCLMWILCTSHPANAQDPVFSQFYSAPLQLNPGLTGISDKPNFALNYRNQWPALGNAYQTYAVSYDQFFDDYHSGIGIYLQADNAGNGILKTYKGAAIYGYQMRINRQWRVRWGVELGLVQSRLDWGQLVFGDQLDPELGPVSPGGTPIPSDETEPENLSLTYIDLGTGGVIYSRHLYAGISIRHLNTPRQSFLDSEQQLTGGLPLRWNLHIGTELPLAQGNNRRNGAFLSPGLMYVRQGPFQQLNFGTFVGFGDVFGGLWYRHAGSDPDAVIAAVGLRKGFVRMTYSFDATISSLSLKSGGSHELGLLINLDDGKGESSFNDCLNLFR